MRSWNDNKTRKYLRSTMNKLGSPKHIATSNHRLRTFSSGVLRALRTEASRSKWIEMQRHAEGRATPTPIIILVAIDMRRSEILRQSQKRNKLTDITPHRNDNVEAPAPYQRVYAIDYVADKKPADKGEGCNFPRIPVPRKGNNEKQGAGERDRGEFRMEGLHDDSGNAEISRL